MSNPQTAPAITVRSINQDIIGMNTPSNLVRQIIPSIAVINPVSFQSNNQHNLLTFSSVAQNAGRLGIFAAQKGSEQRAVMLLLPASGTPNRLMICITQTFEQAAEETLNALGWSHPLSPPFLNFVLLKHVINRWGAQTLAATDDMAFLYIVRSRGATELGPFAHDGAFVVAALDQLVSLTGNAFSYDHVEAFTFSSGVSDFNIFIGAVAPLLTIEAVYAIDPAHAMPVTRPAGARRKQYLSGQTGGARAGFEFLGLDSWQNEWKFATRTTFRHPWPFNYLHNHCMPMYVLNLALNT